MGISPYGAKGRKHKVGGKQKYRVYVDCLDEKGKKKRIQKIVIGHEEAKLLETELKSKYQIEKIIAPITINELADKYILSKIEDNKELSNEKIRRELNKYVLEYYGDLQVDKLTVAMCQNWKDTINKLTYDIKKDNSTRKLSVDAKQRYYRTFNAMLNFAMTLRCITFNPLTPLGNFKSNPNIKGEKVSYYTIEDFNAFIEQAKTHAEQHEALVNYDCYIFFLIAYFTGARRGEIFPLSWDDIKNDFSLLDINKSMTQNYKGTDIIGCTKTKGSTRQVSIPKRLREALMEHYKRQKAVFGDNLKYVCGGERALRNSTLQYRNEKYAEMAGLNKIRIHDFRHSHTSLLANAGINIQEVARRLGHTDVKMTLERYSHMYPQQKDAATEVLDKY